MDETTLIAKVSHTIFRDQSLYDGALQSMSLFVCLFVCLDLGLHFL
jgi:hypothetical protein